MSFTDRLNPPSDTFAQVSLGFTLARGVRRDNQIVCWGDDSDGQSTALSGTFGQISTSGAGSGGSTAGIHACAIKADQTVQCWGDVGTPSPGISVAQPVATFKQVVAGPQHACGILADDSLACWSNTYSPSGPHRPRHPSLTCALPPCMTATIFHFRGTKTDA